MVHASMCQHCNNILCRERSSRVCQQKSTAMVHTYMHPKQRKERRAAMLTSRCFNACTHQYMPWYMGVRTVTASAPLLDIIITVQAMAHKSKHSDHWRPFAYALAHAVLRAYSLAHLPSTGTPALLCWRGVTVTVAAGSSNRHGRCRPRRACTARWPEERLTLPR
jgi:hypothetical protein